MPAICNNAEPTRQMNDNNFGPLAINEMGGGYSGKNADRTKPTNLYTHPGRLFHQMGKGRNIPLGSRYSGRNICLEKHNMQVWCTVRNHD